MSASVTEFVRRRKPDWDALETLVAQLGGKAAVPLRLVDSLEALYPRCASDLALAQRDFPDSEVRVHLERLLGAAYANLYRHRKHAKRTSLRHFYANTYPQAVRLHARTVAAAAAFMGAGAAFGGLLLWLDPTLADQFVSPPLRQYVAEHRLWTDDLLTAMPPSVAAVEIFTNNVSVLFRAYAFGVTFGLATFALLFFNGLSIGATLAHCWAHGLGPSLLVFMAAHGPVELSCIGLGGGAGLLMGQSLLAPGEKSRVEALKESARSGLTLTLGTAPFLVGIGVVEGFVSPGHLFSPSAKVALGLALGVGLWTYLFAAGRNRHAT